MSAIAKITGQRLRTRRQELGYSQELTAEKADLHPTYIGQVERGEKNITIESLEKICVALDYPIESVFSNIMPIGHQYTKAQRCYDLIVNLPQNDQDKLCSVVIEIVKLIKK